MPRLYPSSMNSMADHPQVPVYKPSSGPQSRAEKKRRKEQAEVLKMPISEMLKEMWHCKLQQQCPVDSAGQISSWLPGPKVVTDAPMYATPTPPDGYPLKILQQSKLMDNGYIIDRVGLRKPSTSDLVDHRVATKLMKQPEKGQRPQMQYSAFRTIPHRQPATQALSASSLRLDAKHWSKAKMGLISTTERFPPEKYTSDNNRPFYDVHASIPKRSIEQEISHNRHGTKMPVQSGKGLVLISSEVEDRPSPVHYSVQRPFGQRRPSRMTTHPEEYKAWHDMLDDSDSSRQTRLERQSVRAAGACIGNMFRAREAA